MTPSSTVSSRPPTALPTTGTPQAAASSGVMPNGSYQGVRQDDVGRPVEGRHPPVRHLADQPDPVVDAQLPRQPHQAAGLGVAAQLLAAEDHRPRRARRPAAAASARTAVSNPLRSTRRPTASSLGGLPARPVGPGAKWTVSTPHGTTRQPLRRCLHPRQLAQLVAAGGDDQVGAGGQVALAVEALRGTGVGRALVPALDRSERVERLRHRDGRALGRLQGGQAGHPEVGVDDVRAPVPGPVPRHPAAEPGHQRVEVVLGHRPWWPGRYVDHGRPLPEGHPLGQVRPVPAGVDLDLVPPAAEGAGEGGDVDVLAAGVDSAQGGEGAGVLGHHGDSHRVIPSRSRSQSSRNRLSP